MADQTFELVKMAIQLTIAAGSMAAAFLAWRTKKAVQEVHVSLNSRLTQLLEQTEAAARAAGRDSMRDGPTASGLPDAKSEDTPHD